MSLARQVLSVPVRLLGAVRRHGIGAVTQFGLRTLRRRGISCAVRFAVQGTEEPSFVTSAGGLARPSAPPPDFDDNFTVSAATWAAWLARFPTPQPELTEVPPLTVVVRADSSDAAALETTLSALRGLSVSRGPSFSLRLVAQRAGLNLSFPPPTAADLADPARLFLFLHAGDVPSVHLPAELAVAARKGVAEVFTFDMERPIAQRVQPLFSPGANPSLARAVDHTFGRLALRRSALPEALDLDALDPHEALRAWLDSQPPLQARGRWRHIGRPLVQAAIADHEIDERRAGLMRRAPVPRFVERRVSVVICTKDKGHLNRQLVHHLLAVQSAWVADIAVMANNSTNPYALATLEDIAAKPRIRLLRRDVPFNFSKLCNEGAQVANGGDLLLFLNDDIVPVTPDWMARLVAAFDEPIIGAAGPLLLYPDERVQHAGMYLGLDGGSAGHTLRHALLPQDDYLFTASAPREVSCLTGAALMTRRSHFEALNGFDEILGLQLQDVDYGVRLHRSGARNAFEPAAVLLHLESVSVGDFIHNRPSRLQRGREYARFTARWGKLVTDPLHCAGFDPGDEGLKRLRSR